MRHSPGSLPILPTLCRGGTVVLHQSFDPDAWLDAVEREQINYAFAVPTMLYCECRKSMPPGRIRESRLRRGRAAGRGGGPGW